MMRAALLGVTAILCAAPASADCLDFFIELEVCSTADISVEHNEWQVPFHERIDEGRRTQIWWTVAAPPLDTSGDLETFFWDMWNLVSTRLEGRGRLHYGNDYSIEINEIPSFGNNFTLRSEGSSTAFTIRLTVVEVHGFYVALEVIEPTRGSDFDTTTALIADAIAMIHPNGQGPRGEVPK